MASTGPFATGDDSEAYGHADFHLRAKKCEVAEKAGSQTFDKVCGRQGRLAVGAATALARQQQLSCCRGCMCAVDTVAALPSHVLCRLCTCRTGLAPCSSRHRARRAMEPQVCRRCRSPAQLAAVCVSMVWVRCRALCG